MEPMVVFTSSRVLLSKPLSNTWLKPKTSGEGSVLHLPNEESLPFRWMDWMERSSGPALQLLLTLSSKNLWGSSKPQLCGIPPKNTDVTVHCRWLFLLQTLLKSWIVFNRMRHVRVFSRYHGEGSDLQIKAHGFYFLNSKLPCPVTFAQSHDLTIPM